MRAWLRSVQSVAVFGVAAGCVLALPHFSSSATGGYKVGNSRAGSAVFTAKNVAPGESGRGEVRIRNSGTLPVTFALTQDRVTTTGLEKHLRISIYDATRNYCYYPVRARGACRGFGAWRGGSALANVRLLSRTGKVRWRAGESHLLIVRWHMAPRAPGATQGRRAAFRLLWRSTA